MPTPTEFLASEGGQVSYDDSHSKGPLIVLIAPVGSLRTVYRFLSPKLVTAGCRVVTLDLRGHGQSSTEFSDYSIAAHGRDVVALVNQLDAGPAVLVGNSFSGGVAVWAAVEEPKSVKGIVLIAAFVRKPKVNPIMALVMKLMLAGPWGPTAWMSYYARMYPHRKPADFAIHVAETRRMIKEPGRFAAFKRMMTGGSKDDSESRLHSVKVPALVIMGDADPDFPSPSEEATFQAEALNAKKVMVAGGGHHPQADTPNEVASALMDFLKELTDTS